MKILLTGATGFIGRHVIPMLLAQGHHVTALVRNLDKACAFTWHDQVNLLKGDIHNISSIPFTSIGDQDAVMHLAWADLPNFKAPSHIQETLPANFLFLQTLIDLGTKQIIVSGTCLEYGMQEGCLSETMATQPMVAYALAKESLRKSLEEIQSQKTYTLQWARLFYMYGEGQGPNSLLAQLDHAIRAKNTSFNMSGGKQLRDYLQVNEVARRLCILLEHPDCNGVVNICSGTPISIIDLVKNHLKKNSVNIALNLGFYPYPEYEPMAFWGDTRKFESKCLND